jgi:iron complex outermembrane recepter protein
MPVLHDFFVPQLDELLKNARRLPEAGLPLALLLAMTTGAQAQDAAPPAAKAEKHTLLPPVVVNPDAKKAKGAAHVHRKQTGAPATSSAASNATASTEPQGAPVFTGKADEGYRQTNANFGPLGDRPALNTPYSVYTVPADLIKNEHVETFTELTKYIPSLQQQGHPGLEFGPPVIRGMVADDTSANTRIDGMNVRGDTQLPISLYERFEVLTGPSGALYGFSYPAGTLNGILKRPTDQPFTEATVGFISRERPDIAVDTSGHFGANDAVGYRLNLEHSNGEGYVSTSNLERDVAGIGLDVKPSKDTKVELNANRYYYDQMGFPAGFAYKGGSVALPDALDPTKAGYGQEWGGISATTDITEAKIKHRINENWSVEAGVLRQEADRYFNNRLTNTLNGNGTYTATYSSSASESEVISNLLNVNGVVYTGSLKHELAFGTNGFDLDVYSLTSGAKYTLGTFNLYDPTETSVFTRSVTGARYLSSEIQQQTLVQNDTIHFNEQWSVLLGISEGWLSATNYNSTTHLVQSSFSKDAVLSPVTALMYKPRENITTYVSYTSSVQSDIAPSTGVNNPNEALTPLRSEQYEGGVKASLSKIDLSAAVFYIERPYSAVDTDGYYKNLGNQNDLGAELTAKGKLTDNIVVVGGVTWLDATLADMTGTNAKNNGNKVVGIPEWQTNLLTEYSFDRVPGLTASVNVHYAGKRSADAENYSWADGYVTVDAGARYKSFIMGHEVTWRAAVENIFDEKYWASINGDMSGTNGATNTAYLGAPRTFKASASVKF